jgi:zinc protease
MTSLIRLAVASCLLTATVSAQAPPATSAAPQAPTAPKTPAAPGASVAALVKDPAARLPTDPNLTIGKLPNGLTYYVKENRRPEGRAELWLAVNAGSVLEDPDQQGLAHMVEHMAFNGTRDFQTQDLLHYLESVGMQFGADLPLWPGTNMVTVVARANAQVRSVKTMFIYRDPPRTAQQTPAAQPVATP